MTENDIVITGTGVVSSIGVGIDAFAEGLFGGRSGISRVEDVETGGRSHHLAGQIRGFDPAAILGGKGLAFLDRNATLACSAATLALVDAGLMDATSRARVDERKGAPDVGLVLGTAFGSVESIAVFNREAILDPLFVNPGDFPKTVINAPAGNVAIRCGLQGINATVASGSCSALQAIKLAMDALSSGQVDVVLAGGSEQFGETAYLSFGRAGWLSSERDGGTERPAPFDRRRNGWCLGEGAAIMVLEKRVHAERRGAAIRGRVLGYGEGFDGDGRTGAPLVRAMRSALANAACTRDAIELVMAGASGDRAGDHAEAVALRELFSGAERTPPLSAIKSQVGECLGASGALQVVAALLSMQRGQVAPTLSFEACDEDTPLAGLSATLRSHEARVALVNAQSFDGSAASLVLATGPSHSVG